MHFNIFIPEINAPASRLAELGLPGLVDGVFRANSLGPSGSQGTMCTWTPSNGKHRGRQWLGYDTEKQTWRPAVPQGELAAERYWVGMLNDSAPTPDDLQRPYPYRCTQIELGNHHPWWFPAERELPTQAKLMDDGEWRFMPQREFDSFSQATRDWRVTVQTCNVGVILSEALDFVRWALSINYRLTPEIESDLSLWTGSNSGTICRAFFAIIASEGAFRE